MRHKFRYNIVASLSFLTFFYGANAVANKDATCPSGALGEISENVYQNLSAEQKMDIRWKRILETRYENLPPFESFGLEKAKLLCPHYVAGAFTHVGDTMPGDRHKLIHSSGVAIKLQWKAAGDAAYFSGILAQGSEYVLGRLSLATAPEPGKFIPGLALKILLSGKPSVNIMAMPSLNGQTDDNLFMNPYFTDLTETSSTDGALSLKILSAVFKKGLRELGDSNGSPLILTLDHLANVDSNGKAVQTSHAEKKIAGTYSLRLEPTPALQNLMKDGRSTSDFRSRLQGKGNGLDLFDIFLVTKERSSNGTKELSYAIGKLSGLSDFLASREGDRNLYFQHHANTTP